MLSSRSGPSRRRAQSGHGKAGPSKWQRFSGPGGDVSRILDPAPRVDRDVSGSWHVRYLNAAAARKTYTCPGCRRQIPPGVAHYVVWQTDSLFGDAQAIADRRHWHLKCWDGR